MRIVTCASYFGTGSSAITDFVSEFENVYSLGRFEYRFIQDPDGISDLEYNIVENNHRHNTSHAIKRYIAFIKKLNSFGTGKGYKKFNADFLKYSFEYIEKITELKTKSWWHWDRINRGELFCVVDRAYSLIKRLLNGGLKTEKKYSLLKNGEYGYYSAIDEKTFLSATREYVDKVIQSTNIENKPFVMVDQLLPPTNLDRYTRYFNDVKVIVVERDPRDVYLCEKTRYQWGVVPTNTVVEYIEWFKITRKYTKDPKEDKNKVLRIRFEDLIYHYDDTSRTIMEFLNLNEELHINKFKKFNPKISIKNTNLKSQVSGYEEEISAIELALKEYLYDFDKETINESVNS